MSGPAQHIYGLVVEALRTWFRVASEQGPSVVVDFAKNNPFKAVYLFINAMAMMVFGPAGLLALLLKLVGFGPLGPIAGVSCLAEPPYCIRWLKHSSFFIGSTATWWQSTWFGAVVPPGSIFSALQRLGMALA